MAYDTLEQAIQTLQQTNQSLVDDTASTRLEAEQNAQATAVDRQDVTDKATQVAGDSAAAATAKSAAEAARDQAQQLADPGQAMNAAFDILIKDVERAQFEAATGGACTIERTASGQPSYMFVSARQTWDELMPGGELGTGVHEAFVENGVEKSELLTGMFMASQVNGELVSQPRATGRRSIDWGQAVSLAQASGFSLMSNWEWSFLSFWCMANGFEPRGNTDYGKSHSHPWERGAYDDDSVSEEYTLLGSGPNTWRHNGAANGIADLVGNRWEWQWGFKMVDGRILMAPDNDKSLVESGWVDTGWDMPDNTAWASADAAGAPQSIKRALIMPNGVADPGGYLYTNLEGERFPVRGGNRDLGAYAGLGALHSGNARSNSHTNVGLRLSRLV